MVKDTAPRPDSRCICSEYRLQVEDVGRAPGLESRLQAEDVGRAPGLESRLQAE